MRMRTFYLLLFSFSLLFFILMLVVYFYSIIVYNSRTLAISAALMISGIFAMFVSMWFLLIAHDVERQEGVQ